MTATDKLRRMLDERRVEHGGSDAVVYFEDRRGYKACAYDAPRRYGDGILCVCHTATPEQAIEATLGRRTTTRHGKWRTKYGRSVPCCECCGYGIGDERWHYCPSCGAEVVE